MLYSSFTCICGYICTSCVYAGGKASTERVGTGTKQNQWGY